MRKIKRDDEVIVIAGRDKGKRGKVVRVLAEDRLIVSGINMIKKHQKPNPQLGVAGGIIEKDAATSAYNKRGIKYKVRLTNHIMNLISKDSTNVRLGLVVTESIGLASNSTW